MIYENWNFDLKVNLNPILNCLGHLLTMCGCKPIGKGNCEQENHRKKSSREFVLFIVETMLRR